MPSRRMRKSRRSRKRKGGALFSMFGSNIQNCQKVWGVPANVCSANDRKINYPSSLNTYPTYKIDIRGVGQKDHQVNGTDYRINV